MIVGIGFVLLAALIFYQMHVFSVNPNMSSTMKSVFYVNVLFVLMLIVWLFWQEFKVVQ